MLAIVNPAIEFHREHDLGAIEVDDVGTDAMLPSELERSQRPQSVPEAAFGGSGFSSQAAFAVVRHAS